MNHIRLRRQIGAWLSLAVFVPMLLLASLHSHPDFGGLAGDDCTYCFDHVPHDGHLSSPTVAVDDCVLCQFFSLTFVAAATLVASFVACHITDGTTVYTAFCAQTVAGLHHGRAPPFGF